MTKPVSFARCHLFHTSSNWTHNTRPPILIIIPYLFCVYFYVCIIILSILDLSSTLFFLLYYIVFVSVYPEKTRQDNMAHRPLKKWTMLKMIQKYWWFSIYFVFYILLMLKFNKLLNLIKLKGCWSHSAVFNYFLCMNSISATASDLKPRSIPI